MKRAYLPLVFLAYFAVINGYAAGGKDQSLEEHIAEINEMSMKIDELERAQKALKDELEKSKRDMDGFARKLATILPNAGLESIFSDDVDDAYQAEDSSANGDGDANGNGADANEVLADAQRHEGEDSANANGAGLPAIPQNIVLGAGQSGYLTQSAVIEYMQKFSRPPAWFSKNDISTIVSAYFREAEIERVNPDIALAQMWYATQSLTHSTLLRHCNYANLEPISDVEGVNDWDGIFSNSDAGVKAHIQHLKAYAEAASADADPRYKILEINGFLGKGDTLAKLCAMWTKDTSGKYENSLYEILTAMYQFQAKSSQ